MHQPQDGYSWFILLSRSKYGFCWLKMSKRFAIPYTLTGESFFRDKEQSHVACSPFKTRYLSRPVLRCRMTIPRRWRVMVKLHTGISTFHPYLLSKLIQNLCPFPLYSHLFLCFNGESVSGSGQNSLQRISGGYVAKGAYLANLCLPTLCSFLASWP